MGKVQILALITDGYGASGGIAQYNCAVLAALSGCEAVGEVVVVPRFGKSAQPLPRGVSQLPAARGRMAWITAATRQVLTGSFDLIYCGHLYAAGFAAALAKLVARPLWLQVHGLEAWQAPGWPIRRATERADLITAVSRYTRARLLAWSNIDPSRVRVLPNTVEDRFRPAPACAELADRLGVRGRSIILTVSRLAASEQYKGHDRVIQALPEVIKACPEAMYLVAGDGDDRSRLESLAHALGVGDHVEFAGHVSADDLPRYFQLADVFAMPSTGEGFGIVLLEAAASGVPVIAGNRDGSVDALADGRIGRLIDPADTRALTAAILEAFDGGRQLCTQAVQRFAFPNFAAHVGELVQRFV